MKNIELLYADRRYSSSLGERPKESSNLPAIAANRAVPPR